MCARAFAKDGKARHKSNQRTLTQNLSRAVAIKLISAWAAESCVVSQVGMRAPRFLCITVVRDGRVARSWLFRELSEGSADEA